MARTVTWTASAVNDLDSVAEFIAKDSRFYAITVVRKARDLARSLSVVAQRGRIVPESHSADIREVFLWHYRLIYKVTPERVYILAFIHGARDLSSIFNYDDGVSSDV